MAEDPVMTAAELTTFIRGSFPGWEPPHVVEAIGPGRTVVRLPATHAMLRPGGTVSGPTLMTMADTAAWAAVLAEIGPVALSVTSHLSIHFLRKPQPGDVVATTEVLRRGRRQAVIDVRITSGGDPAPVAQATVTYAIPSMPSSPPPPA
ncbi:PaaI family thioesterase [Iamia sp.]|uniref:PaaI family thioesterase n=1 Tax=Iamia sp. TaxID=2722710 RepID=UPI002CB691B1|nr:PaaI family thioesterase [Iamia sp.]HXH55909.1 PaaI family thioesterase [Iamia sp.]